MVINSLCNSCFQAFTILVETKDIDLLRQIASGDGSTSPCPRLCGGNINLVGDPVIAEMVAVPGLKEPMSITGTELYKAVKGAGLRDELPKEPEVVAAMLTSSRVKATHVEKFDGKLYLHELELDNGVTVHLAKGLHGAQVLKLTRGK